MGMDLRGSMLFNSWNYDPRFREMIKNSLMHFGVKISISNKMFLQYVVYDLASE